MSQIKQSLCWWCFAGRGITPKHLLRAAADIGYSAVELVEQDYWPLIKEYGLTIASTNGGLSITQGLNRREHHAHLEQQLGVIIKQAEQWSLFYPPIIRAILETSYQGYLGQEFIPRGNPIVGLKQAFDLCSVSL